MAQSPSFICRAGLNLRSGLRTISVRRLDCPSIPCLLQPLPLARMFLHREEVDKMLKAAQQAGAEM